MNFLPGEFVKIYEYYNQGKIEKAAKLQEQVNEVIGMVVAYENRSYQKAVMRYIGYDCGYFRKPFEPLTEAEYAEFAKRLETFDLLNKH